METLYGIFFSCEADVCPSSWIALVTNMRWLWDSNICVFKLEADILPTLPPHLLWLLGHSNVWWKMSETVAINMSGKATLYLPHHGLLCLERIPEESSLSTQLQNYGKQSSAGFIAPETKPLCAKVQPTRQTNPTQLLLITLASKPIPQDLHQRCCLQIWIFLLCQNDFVAVFCLKSDV